MSRQIVKTPFFSFRINALPRGCQLCVQGKKTVLFITGLCARHCSYCPISDQKKDKDVVYANEWPTKRLQDLFKEIELCGSEGVGITGGDPLVKIGRTVKYVKALKKRFEKKGGSLHSKKYYSKRVHSKSAHSKRFHIHLYTPLDLVDEKRLKMLFDAGLDEIRFHPDIDSNKLWDRIKLARAFKWKLGVEIPVIPGKIVQTKKLIDFLAKDDKIDFLNLNELELSDTNASRLSTQGFVSKDRISYGVKGSEEMAKRLLNYCKSRKFERSVSHSKDFHVHYCTCRLKDAVQLRERIKRRARNAAKEFDYVDEEGMLIRGAVYGNLEKARLFLRRQGVPARLIYIQQKTKNHDRRLLTSAAVIADFEHEIKRMHCRPAIVKDYPTYDSLPVEVNFL